MFLVDDPIGDENGAAGLGLSDRRQTTPAVSTSERLSQRKLTMIT